MTHSQLPPSVLAMIERVWDEALKELLTKRSKIMLAAAKRAEQQLARDYALPSRGQRR